MSEIEKISDLMVLPYLTDIHLFMSSLEEVNNTRLVMARTRIAGKISKEKQIEIDVPQVFQLQGTQNAASLNLKNTCLRIRTMETKSVDDGLTLFIRVLPMIPPPIEKTCAGYFFNNTEDFETLGSGLILVSGQVGSGKSTFIASILQHIISRFPIHVVTIEDPVEYIFNPQKGYATQKELDFNSPMFKASLHACMREDPDLLFIGEIRDRETAETALVAAETGHLVFGTIHAGSNSGAIDRIMGLMGTENPNYTAQRISQCAKMCVHIKRRETIFEYSYAKIDDSLRTIIRNKTLHLWNQYIITEPTFSTETQQSKLLLNRNY
ncbi:hypothetical protein FACS1894187_11200 [Synergistales bacterium]|nr:hypothetical protein FACS1894187_11200 [Synergistales bacterium]